MSLNIEQQLRAAKAAMKSGRADEARVLMLQALDRYPDNARLLAGLAEAQKVLTGLPAQGFGPANLQHFLAIKARRGLPFAVEEIAAAVRLNPKNPWPRGVLGGALVEAGFYPAAIRELRAALKLDPKFKEAGLNLANALGLVGETAQALAVLDTLLAQNPEMPQALRMKGHALLQLQRNGDAAEVLARYLAGKPQDDEARIDYAVALRAGNEDQAEAELRAVLSRHPDNPRATGNLGNVLLAKGDLDAAAAALEKTLALNPKSAIGFFNLGRVKDFQPGDPLIARMQALVDDPAFSDDERIALHFGLAKALEDVGDAEGSFRHLKTGNDLRRAESTYDVAQDIALLDALVARLGAGAGPALPGDPGLARRPIFVLGMMRSGTTLMEQILSSHPLVSGAGELQVLPELAAPELLAHNGPLDDAALRRIRDGYLAAIAAQPGDSAFVVDKLPANFRMIGLIRKALPEARILHMRRDPVAVCWSIYKTHFTETGIGYAHSLTDTIRYYDRYAQMMQEWRRDYPDGFLDVDYEALTRDPETTIRAVLEFCGLPFDAACLAPQENRRSVRTASVRQVRSGIYQGSSGKWKAFAPFLTELTQHFGTSVS